MHCRNSEGFVPRSEMNQMQWYYDSIHDTCTPKRQQSIRCSFLLLFCVVQHNSIPFLVPCSLARMQMVVICSILLFNLLKFIQRRKGNNASNPTKSYYQTQGVKRWTTRLTQGRRCEGHVPFDHTFRSCKNVFLLCVCMCK